MIKNAPEPVCGALGLAACFALVVACDGARAKQEAPLQGVIEHDDRVIGFELAGRVLEVSVERGASLALGAKLARLDDALELPQRDLRVADIAMADAQLRLLRAGARSEDLRAAEAEVAAIAAQEQEAGSQLRRQSALYAAGAAPQSGVDDLSAQLKALGERKRALEQRHKALRAGARVDEVAAAQARADAARASLALTEARIARYALLSPAAGTIVDVHVKAGEMVAAGTPAITLADLDHPYVDVFVPEGRMQGIAVGARTEVRVDGVAAPLKGTIEHVFPRTEFTPRYLFSEGERPNLVIRTRVRIEDKKHVLHEGVPAFVSRPVKP
jgi:HlyD family secretion protein